MTDIQTTTVSSSNVAAVGYDPSSGTLQVDFKNGNRYQYQGVSQETYDGIFGASSVGSYLYQQVFLGDKGTKL